MTKHAVGVLNGNFRNGDYFRYAQSVSKAKADLCPKCGNKMSLPMYLVGKSDVCYSCYEAPHPVELATAAEADPAREAGEIAETLELVGGEAANFPTYDQLIAGAKFTDEHRAHVRKSWNELHSDEAVQARIKERGALQ